MKTIQKGLAGLIAILIIVSCSKKDTTPPTGAETNATLLAGAQGGSKSWKITSIMISSGGNSQTYTTTSTSTNIIPACEADNIFLFSHNATQTYQQTEGATTCTANDPATLESGSWAFTTDGKSLLIDATVYVTSTQASAEQLLSLLILSEGEPLTVTQITDSSMTLTYTYTDTSGTTPVTYTFTLIFAKI